MTLSGFFIFNVIFSFLSLCGASNESKNIFTMDGPAYRSQPKAASVDIQSRLKSVEPTGLPEKSELAVQNLLPFSSIRVHDDEASDLPRNRMPASVGGPIAQGDVSLENPSGLLAASQDGQVFLKCVKSPEMRWLRLFRLSNGKCKTIYSKSGNAQEVSAASTYQGCETVLKNVKRNLEGGGYLCEERILLGALEVE